VDYRDLTSLLVKLFGAFLIVQTLAWWPSYLAPALEFARSSPRVFITAAIIPVIFPLATGIFLFWLPATVTNKVLRDERTGNTATVSLKQLERVGITVLAVYLGFRGLSDLVFGSVKFFSLRHIAEAENNRIPNPGAAAEFYGNFFASCVEIVVAFFLVLGARRLQRLLERLRGQESF
jgi:hypothetical protein